MPIRRLKWPAIAATSLGASLAASPAAHAAAAASETTLEEIVVTATRTETSIQKTPVALTVYTGEDLDERNVRDLNALQTIDASLQITQNRGTPYVAIRGVESTNTTEVGNPSVSVARDGFFSNRAYTLGLSFYDLERIEVLKGPQGTLFGRNSTGGLLNIITAKPKLGEVSGYVTGNIGDYSLLAGNGALNLPLGDTVAVRLSGYGSKRDGYRNVTGIGLRGDDDDSRSARLQVYWKPTEHFDWLLGYQYDRSQGVGQVQAIGLLGQAFTGDPKRFPGYTDASLKVTDRRFTWTGTLSGLPLNGVLTYTGGVDDVLYDQIIDTSGVNRSGVFTKTQFGQHQPVQTQNHELRYAGSSSNGLSFQFGTYYFREHNDHMRAGQIVAEGPFAGQYVITFNYDVYQTSRAFFGQASYDIRPDMKITVGARNTSDTVRRDGVNILNCTVAGIPPFLFGALGCTGTPPANITTSAARQDASKATYRFGYDWQVTPDNFLYAKIDSGYKPGGFSTDPTQPNAAFGPETVQAFEIGSKNRFAGGRLTLNADVFMQTLDGFQATLPSALGGGTINAGKTHSSGLELFVAYSAATSTRFDLNTTYLHGRFDRNIAKVDDGTGTLISIAGNTLPNAPSVVAAFGAEQVIALGSGRVTLRLEGKYNSSVYYDVVNRADTRAPAVTTGNFAATYVSMDRRWTAQAYVKNFTDQLVYGRISRTGLIASNTFQFQAPRTVGAQATYRF